MNGLFHALVTELLHRLEELVNDKTPVANHNSWSARLQVLPLTGDAFALVFDQLEGPRPPSSAVDQWKAATGARGVVFTEGVIVIDDDC